MTQNGSVVTLGMFDGVHMGHSVLISRTVELAEKLDCTGMVYTFNNHPQTVLGGKLKLLMTATERCEQMLYLGVEKVVMAEFDNAVAIMQPEEFIKSLITNFGMKYAVAGYDYTFGHMGRGDKTLLLELGRKLGFQVEIVPPVMYGEESVSSSRIRACLLDGHVTEAGDMLTRPYELSGKVAHNKHIGTGLGFPTANLIPDKQKLIPKNGVYLTRTMYRGREYCSITNIGNNPTVGGEKTTIETFLLDFTGNIYGQSISVRFLSFIREEKIFSTVEQLSEQIARDVDHARVSFGL